MEFLFQQNAFIFLNTPYHSTIAIVSLSAHEKGKAMKNALSTVTKLSNADWLKNSEWMLDLVKTPQPSFEKPLPLPFQSRLIRVDEINEEGHQAYRQALANVYGTLDAEQAVRFLYLLCGSASGVELYFGVVSDTENGDVHEAMKNLRGALEGQLTGINFGDDVSAENRDALFKAFSTASQQGVMLGAPTAQGQDDANEEDSFQGFDRLVRALQSSNSKDTQSEGRWKLAVVSQPLGRAHIRQQLDSAYELSSRLTTLVKTSVQSSDNTSRQKSTSIGSSEAKARMKAKVKTGAKTKGGQRLTQRENQAVQVLQAATTAIPRQKPMAPAKVPAPTKAVLSPKRFHKMTACPTPKAKAWALPKKSPTNALNIWSITSTNS